MLRKTAVAVAAESRLQNRRLPLDLCAQSFEFAIGNGPAKLLDFRLRFLVAGKLAQALAPGS